MKICFLMSALFSAGGEQRVVTTLANELCLANEITIISFGDRNEEAYYYLKPEICVIKLPEVEYTLLQKAINKLNRKSTLLQKWRKILEYSYMPNKLAKQLKELLYNKYDVVIGVAGFYSILLGFIADEIKTMTIGWEHNSYEAYFRLPGKYYWHLDLIFQKYVEKLDHCIVLNERIASKYKTELGIDTQVIYNPRSFESVEKAELENKYFIATGRFTYQKGFDYLIEAFRIFSGQNQDWKLRILGNGELLKNIEKEIADYNLQNRVELLGFQKDVKSFLLDSSVFILSSRWEGFPMSVTEALEVGLPVIAFDIEAIQPLVTQRKEGILIEPFNCEKMAKAMLELAEDPQLRKRLALNGIEKAQKLSNENILTKWEKLLEGCNP